MNRSYRDLLVWQKAMDLVVECYRLSREFPKFETYGLANQIQRAAVSVPSNIAEGNERQGAKEFLHFLSIARGSLGELETQLEIAARLGYIEPAALQNLLQNADEIGKMMGGLRKTLQSRLANS